MNTSWHHRRMQMKADVDVPLAAAFTASVARVAARTPPGWAFGHGVPPAGIRVRMVLLYARRLPWAWRRAGWRTPGKWILALPFAYIVVMGVFLATVISSAAQGLVALLMLVAACVVMAAAILLPILVVYGWRLTAPGARKVLWCHGPGGLAVAFVKQRRDGVWYGSDLVSTGHGEGAHLMNLATTLAAEVGVTVELDAAVPDLVPYYEAHGFVTTGPQTWLARTRMQYLAPTPRAPSGT